MLESDVRLGAHVRHLDVRGSAGQFGVRGPAQNLDRDGFLGGAERLHCLFVGGLGEILAIDLRNQGGENTPDNRERKNALKAIGLQQDVSYAEAVEPSHESLCPHNAMLLFCLGNVSLVPRRLLNRVRDGPSGI